MNRAVGRCEPVLAALATAPGRRRGPVCRRDPLGYRKWGGFADNISCVATGKHPACQPSAEPKFSFRGASRTGEHGVRSGASRLCAPVYADSSVRAARATGQNALAIRRSVGVRAARATGAQSKPGAETDGRGVSPLPVF